MKKAVNAVFEGLARGLLTYTETGPTGGWTTTLPGGLEVARTTLQTEARPLIALGAEAIPHLLPWVKHENAGLRFVAVFALGEITGERPSISHFDKDLAQWDAPIASWRRWYEQRIAAPPG